jgi:hypothetical protein
MFISRRPRSSNRRFHLGVALAAAAAIASALLAPPERRELGCGGDPPPPFCATTYVLSLSGPFTELNLGAVTIPFETLHFFDINDVPPGSGVCPPPPYLLTVTVEGICPTGSAPPVTVGPIPITPGFTALVVPLSFPPDVQRECLATATGVVTLLDGTVLSQTRTQGVCIVDPPPVGPLVPRLDLQPLTPTIAHVHPGDQSLHRYRLRNNDPLNSWTGTLEARMVNVSTTPLGPPNRVYAVSDPGSGDNYPMEFEDLLPPGGCIPLPPDPHSYVSTLARSFTLLPGESRIVGILSRPWGMCANGSCGQKTVKLTGVFSDGDAGLACAGATVAADTSIPPVRLWPDAGEVIDVHTPGPFPPQLLLTGRPEAAPIPREARVFIDPSSVQLRINGVPTPTPVQVQSMPLNPEAGRLETRLQFAPVFRPAFFDIFVDVPIDGLGPTGPINLLNMDVVPDAPSGLSDLAPIAMGVATVDHAFALDSFFDVFYQISADGITPDFGFRRMRFQTLELSVLPGGGGIRAHARLEFFGPGSEPFTGIILRQDFRGFARLGTGGPACDSIDFNNDGSSFDPQDIEAFLSVFSEGPCIPLGATCNDIDFNNDGALFDPCDIDAFLLLFSEGPCTICGV